MDGGGEPCANHARTMREPSPLKAELHNRMNAVCAMCPVVVIAIVAILTKLNGRGQKVVAKIGNERW